MSAFYAIVTLPSDCGNRRHAPSPSPSMSEEGLLVAQPNSKGEGGSRGATPQRPGAGFSSAASRVLRFPFRQGEGSVAVALMTASDAVSLL